MISNATKTGTLVGHGVMLAVTAYSIQTGKHKTSPERVALIVGYNLIGLALAAANK